MSQPKLHVFTPVWGPHFTDLLIHALGQSFRWPKNQEALENATWTLVVDDENAGAIGQARAIIPTAKIQPIVYPELKNINAQIGAIKMQGLLKAMRQCIEEKTPMLMATPDFIYGDGTISNMLAASRPNSSQNLCVSIAHLRTLPKTMSDLSALPLPPSNSQLLSVALSNAHPSWTYCNEELDVNGIYHSGVCWRRLTPERPAGQPAPEGPGLILVSHQMPSPFLVNFTPQDRTDFSIWKGLTAPAFGEWDHNWPTNLINSGRLRYIGGSDAACMVEITDLKNNTPPLQPKAPNIDDFFLNKSHNLIQKQFLSVFRHD